MFRRLPPAGGDQRAVAEIVNGMMDGKTNNTGTITLAVGGATTTTLSDPRISRDSDIILVPKTADAFSTAVYASSQTNGSATLTHAANSTAGKTYGYVVVG
jgi:hypothetical protein